MKLTTTLLAAGFTAAALTAASAESGYETRNGVNNAPDSHKPAISQLTSSKPDGDRYDDRRHTPARHGDVLKTRNTGFAHGYTTFQVLDSIR